jgi:hypothetical protein
MKLIEGTIIGNVEFPLPYEGNIPFYMNMEEYENLKKRLKEQGLRIIKGVITQVMQICRDCDRINFTIKTIESKDDQQSYNVFSKHMLGVRPGHYVECIGSILEVNTNDWERIEKYGNLPMMEATTITRLDYNLYDNEQFKKGNENWFIILKEDSHL